MSKIPTREEREEWRKLHTASTQGEWKQTFSKSSWGNGIAGIYECPVDKATFQREADQEFIIAAHENFPSLLDAIDTLEQRLSHALSNFDNASMRADDFEKVCVALKHRLAAAEADTARQLLLLKGLVNYRASYMPSISPVISETLAVLDAARKEGK